MDEPRVDTLQVGNIRMRVASQGSGPLVLLCHGFPESWRSWRAQMAALAAAGYRAVAPDMRGYGGTDAPADATRTRCCITSATWSSSCACYRRTATRHRRSSSAMTGAHQRVECRAVAAGPVSRRRWLERAFSPPSRTDLLSALEQMGVKTFYMQYFQTPGVAEAELEADPEATIRRIWYSMSGDGPGGVAPWPASCRLGQASSTPRWNPIRCRIG